MATLAPLPQVRRPPDTPAIHKAIGYELVLCSAGRSSDVPARAALRNYDRYQSRLAAHPTLGGVVKNQG